MTNYALSTSIQLIWITLLTISLTLMVSVSVYRLWKWLGQSPNQRIRDKVSTQWINLCCGDVSISAIYGPMVFSLLLHKATFYMPSPIQTALEIGFVCLFLTTTLSFSLYLLNRHCLIARKRCYTAVYGKLRPNVKVYASLWVLCVASGLCYFPIQNKFSINVPFVFQIHQNIIYCIFALVILYFIPLVINFMCITNMSLCIHRKLTVTETRLKAGIRRKWTPAQVGLYADDRNVFRASIVLFIIRTLTCTPWPSLQVLLATEICKQVAIEVHMICLASLLIGTSITLPMETILSTSRISCCFLRRYEKTFSPGKSIVTPNLSVVSNDILVTSTSLTNVSRCSDKRKSLA